MKPGVFYLKKMMNFMKMRTFYKKLPLFIKNCPLLFIKNSMLQIVIYKKLNFWEEYTPLWRCVFVLELYFHFDMSYQGFPEAHQRFSENET